MIAAIGMCFGIVTEKIQGHRDYANRLTAVPYDAVDTSMEGDSFPGIVPNKYRYHDFNIYRLSLW